MKQIFARRSFLLAPFRRTRALYCVLLLLAILTASANLLFADDAPRRIPVSLGADDVLPKGNEWIALPEIHSGDGTIASFNVLKKDARRSGPCKQYFTNPAQTIYSIGVPTLRTLNTFAPALERAELLYALCTSLPANAFTAD